MEFFGFFLCGLGLILMLLQGCSASLSPSGVNYEVVALMAIKNDLTDPHNVLENWDITFVDPCSWRMVTCSPDGYVSALGLPSQSLSGTLSPGIGNLTNLQYVLMQNNAISGSIPASIVKLEKLQTLDLSSNKFHGEMPSSFGDLKNLNYLRLNNNSLTGKIPDSLSGVGGLTLVDMSFNNFTGPMPKLSARTFRITGNPLICPESSENNCSVVNQTPLSFPSDDQIESGTKDHHHIAIAVGTSFGAALLIKSEGSWSHKLYRELSSPLEHLDISVEGPYGPTSSHFLRREALVMISGGSGVTPFISIIREVIYQSTQHNRIPKLILVCAFKNSSHLSMLNLLLPLSATPLDTSRKGSKSRAWRCRLIQHHLEDHI